MHALSRVVLLAFLSAVSSTAQAQTASEPERLLRTYREISAGQGSERERLQRLFDTGGERSRWESSPVSHTIRGERARWWSNVPEVVEARRKLADAELVAIRSIDRSAVAPEDQLNYDLFLWLAETAAQRLSFPTEYIAIDWHSGVQRWATGWVTNRPAKSVTDYEETLAWLRGIPLRIDEDVARMREGLRQGITPARAMLLDEAAEIEKQIVKDPLTSAYLRPFLQFPDSIPIQEQARLRHAAVRTYNRGIRPAYERLSTFFTREYLPRARESVSWAVLPRGREWYAERVRARTSSDIPPEALHEIGLAEMRRAQAGIDSVRQEVGFEGSYSDFIRFITTDPQFLFPDSASLIQAVREMTRRIDPQILKVSRQLPRLVPYAVEPYPASQAGGGIARVLGGSWKDGRPPTYYVNTHQLPELQRWKLEMLTLHEAYPGHLFAYAWAQQLDSVPAFRRYLHFGAFDEGWGMYAETLGSELGLYKDPYSRMGQRNARLTRALRLAVETGIHVHGWTREQAIEFWREQGTNTDQTIELNVDRAINYPGSLAEYMVGVTAIETLRTQAERELGSRFDVRDFHYVILRNGPLPLTLLEAEVGRWIAEQKAGAER